jgi:hypothetical protein
MRTERRKEKTPAHVGVMLAALVSALVPATAVAVLPIAGTTTTTERWCPSCKYEVPSSLLCDRPDTHHSIPGYIAGSVVNPDVRACLRLAGEATKTIDVPLLGSTEYGVHNAWKFRVQGPIEYTYSAPFTLEFDLPGCVQAGWPVRMRNVRFHWGNLASSGPVLSGTHQFDYSTDGYVRADFPFDGLDHLVLDFTQHPDHLALRALVPTIPLADSIWIPETGELPIGGDFDDGTACFSGGCSTLAGTGMTLATEGGDVQGSGTLDQSGDNFIALRTAANASPLAWSSGADQIALAANVLLRLPPPPAIVGGVLEVLDLAGFDLDTTFDMAVKRRDDVFIERVRVGTAVANVDPQAPAGDTTLTFSLPITYRVNTDSSFWYPLSFNVTFDGPGFDPQTLVHYAPGTELARNFTRPEPTAWDILLQALGLPPNEPDLSCVSQGTTWFDKTAVLTFDVGAYVFAWGSGPGAAPDGDGDGDPDELDNCPTDSNADQLDADADEVGDVCDPDDDNDGVVDGSDNCRLVPNADQVNLDGSTGDLAGDACDPDLDGDGTANEDDNCTFAPNPGQEDGEADGIGDACDGDDDNDGIADAAPDNCPYDFNPKQRDNDTDGLGDTCDPDDDDDGVSDSTGVVPLDNCPFSPNPLQEDLDGDALGDACDPDDDDDGDGDTADNCPAIANGDQANNDGDGDGDACDPDDDDDGVADDYPDNCLFLANADQSDLDQDGLGDACDGDRDGDGVLEPADNCAWVPNAAQLDTDGDGAGDACDPDDDNDGVADDHPDNCPLLANGDQLDLDGDRQGDPCDPDDDNDGVADGSDNCSGVVNAGQLDTDGDALGNACDDDDDADGVLDVSDACPLQWTDADADGNGCSDLVADLSALVDKMGLVKGSERSLAAQADAAAKASAPAAANILDAFIQHVSAQRGKRISENDADVLVQFATHAKQAL